MPLFKFVDENQAEQYGAKSIVPEPNHVNVVKDYAWTVQPQSARKDVPYLYMIERKLTNDVMIQQILYNLAAGFDVGNQTISEFYAKLNDTIETEQQNNTNENGEEGTGGTGTGVTGSKDKEITKEEKDFISNTKELFSSENPYSGLYSLEDTGWSYILPYFDSKNHDIGGNWGTIGETGGLMGKISGIVTSGATALATDVNKLVSALGSGFGATDSVRVGTYIEQAKQYNFDAQGPSYSVNFNLYNTGNITDVIDNWELCFALMYNLLPNRKTKTIFDPPPLYEIHIPGVRRSPVSFIKGMQVNFLGATRLMDLQVGGQTDVLRTIVPDAYSITIDIEDVLPESKNFMESMVSVDEKIRVSVTTSSDGETVNRDTDTNKETEYNNITQITL